MARPVCRTSSSGVAPMRPPTEERVALGVARRQPGQRDARVDVGVGGRDEDPRQHDPSPAPPDVMFFTAVATACSPAGRGEGAVGVADAAGRDGGGHQPEVLLADGGQPGPGRRGGRPRPGGTTRTDPAEAGSKVKLAEARPARSRAAHLVVDVGVAEGGGQPGAGPGEPAGPRRYGHPQCLAPRHQAVAVVHPRIGGGAGEQGDEVTGVAYRDRADHERGMESEGDAHLTHFTQKLNVFDIGAPFAARRVSRPDSSLVMEETPAASVIEPGRS